MKKLNTKAMSEAIEKIVYSLGYDVLKAANVNQFQSAVNDFMPGTMFEVEKQTLSQCIRIGVGDKFIQAVEKTEEEQKCAVANIQKSLLEDYALHKDRVDCIINAFAQALKISPQVYNIDEVITEEAQPTIITEAINANSAINSSSANNTADIFKKNKLTNSYSGISNASNKTANQPITNENSLNRYDREFVGILKTWIFLLFVAPIAVFLFKGLGLILACPYLGVISYRVSAKLWSVRTKTFAAIIIKIIFIIAVWFISLIIPCFIFLFLMWLFCSQH